MTSMKVAYPISHSFDELTSAQLALKIARHSPCTSCDNCTGLHPGRGVQVVPDDALNESSLGELGQYGSDDEDLYLDICACGHGVREHGANEAEIGSEEYRRRASYAIRIDENLQDVGKLLDFAYSDPDIESLKRRMIISVSSLVAPSNPLASPGKHPWSFPPQRISLPRPTEQHVKTPPLSSPASSALSDIPPPNKKRRISLSSFSGDEDDDDDDEEDKPLATRMAQKVVAKSPQKHRGGKAPHTTTATRQPHTNGRPVTTAETKVQIEEKMDESQITRLATGVPVDSAESAAPPVKTEKAAAVELRKGIIQITAVENDKHPRSLIILTGLKTLFQKQLPKMPREYIARLVYDNNSKALAIIKRGYKVVGGICFRPFEHRGFAEIVFFATASVDQVKGYGGMLMDHFKAHIRKAYPGMSYFLTYADNYAVGYFEKQGFSKEITLDRSVWAGYIKDYEGGTIMQCTMLRKVDYLDKANILAQQQEAIMSKIRQMSRSHIVHPGLPQFQDGEPENMTVDPQDVPGLRESGWTPSMAEHLIRLAPKSADRHFMERLMKDLQGHNQAWPFLVPVNGDDVPDYYEVIKNPMDFSTMEHKLENNQYSSVDDFVRDARLIFDNCRLYNQEGTVYPKCANGVEKFLNEQLKDRIKREI